VHIGHNNLGAKSWKLVCNSTWLLGDRKCVILHQTVRGSVISIQNTRAFLVEARAVTDATEGYNLINSINNDMVAIFKGY
jgi:hypothetical protein